MLTPRTEFYITAFLGFTGIHRLLKKEIKIAILYFFTFGLFYIGWIIDAIKAYGKMKQATIGSHTDCDGFFLKKQIVDNNNNYTQQVRRVEHKDDLETECHNIDSMDGIEFEQYCAELLRKLGYSSVTCTPGAGDQGVDIVAVKNDVRYAIQCKRYSSVLGNTPIQEVTAGKAYYRCHVAVVLTNSHFTPAAKNLAEANGVLLWSREKLHEMINEAAGLNKVANMPI